ncbi:9939_t:CDS:2 [Ambispora leptoticha]|uniref:9939_t:CDS:1 n=1 Tax=Ambispora leptoticha TaxID=144679 RepID=A0A9N8Z0G2_9GLOM|nr:9939_t:CDS:2 [Ambispora leptoticha]
MAEKDKNTSNETISQYLNEPYLRERRYKLIKIQKRFKKWNFYQNSIFKQTVFLLLCSLITLAFGIYLYNWGKKDTSISVAKNVVTVVLFGGGSIGTLIRSWFSLSSLFLYYEAIDDDEVAKKFDDKAIENSILNEELENIKKVFFFLKTINNNIQYMETARTIYASLMACAILVLTVISIFFLTSSPNVYLFQCMIITQISLSSLCLWTSFFVMVGIKVFIPWEEEEENMENENKFRESIPLKEYFQGSLKLKILMVFFFPILFKLGLVSIKMARDVKFIDRLKSIEFELKRITMTRDEVESVKRLIFCVSMKDKEVQLEINDNKLSNTSTANDRKGHTNKQSNTVNDQNDHTALTISEEKQADHRQAH